MIKLPLDMKYEMQFDVIKRSGVKAWMIGSNTSDAIDSNASPIEKR